MNFLVVALLQAGLTGTVLHGAAPVAGARVIAGELGHALLQYESPSKTSVITPGVAESEARRWAVTLVTDEAGGFAAPELAAGEYTVLASDPQATPRGIAFTTIRLREGERRNLRLVLQPPGYVVGSVSGIAADPKAWELGLAPRRRLSNLSLRPEWERLERADGTASFRSRALPAVIEWDLVGRLDGVSTPLLRIPVDAHPGEETKVALELGGGVTISGRVLDQEGRGVAGASIVATSGKVPTTELGTVTDGEGRYRLGGLAIGTWKLIAKLRRARTVEIRGGSAGAAAAELVAIGKHSLLIADGNDQPADVHVAAVGPPQIGDEAPDFDALLFDGHRLSLSQLRGRVVALFFWKSSDERSREVLGQLADAYGSWSKDGRLEILGVALDEEPGSVRRFAASRPLPWPQTALGADEANPIGRLYGEPEGPWIVLIGADGKIVAFARDARSPLRETIEHLLAK
jgi:peroxiredoxin